MSSIHYKFKATLEYKTLIFSGLHISVNDLKKEICEKENIKADSFDLLLTNAHTKRQYTADEFIPRNSSVIVQRTPRDNAAKLPKVQDSTNSGIVTKAATTSDNFTGHIESEQFNQLSEEERIAHIKEVSAYKYQPSNFQKKSSSILWGPPPPTYQCNRCSQSGHWYKNCPMLNTRRTTGITMDELMETTADDPLAMWHPSGKYVVQIMHWKARQQKKTELSRAPEPDTRIIPPELKCPLCSQLLRDAVLTTCCGDSFCAECVQQRLLESVNAKCPGANCIQPSISADKIVPNLKVRQAVEAFKKAAPSAQTAGPASALQQTPVVQQQQQQQQQQPSVDASVNIEEMSKVQAQPVPRVRIGLLNRLQQQQQSPSLTSTPPHQQNMLPATTQQQHQQTQQLTSQTTQSSTCSPSLSQADVDVNVQQQQQQPQQVIIRPSLPVQSQSQSQPTVASRQLQAATQAQPSSSQLQPPLAHQSPSSQPPQQQQQQPQIPTLLLPPPTHQHQPNRQPALQTPAAANARGGVLSAPPSNVRTASMLLAPQTVLPMGLNVHQPPPGYSISSTSTVQQPIIATVQPQLQPVVTSAVRGMGLPSMNAPPPSLMVQHPPVQPPPPGLSSATTFPSVRAPPPVRDAWDEFIERKEKDRLLVASHTSRRRHSSPSESYSSSESSSESSSSSRSRSRSRSSSWSRDRERERTRRKRRRSSHSSRERRRTRRTDLSHSPSRPYVLPASAVSSSRYHRNHRDNSLSHSFFTQQQHATHPHPHAPNSMAINTSGIPSGSPFPPPHSHRIPPLITFPPPPFLNLPPNTAASSFGAFQSTPTSLMSTNYRNTATRNAATGASPFMFDERSQRRRSPRLPEPDRRGGTRTGGGVREREREKERDNERKERSRTDDSSSNRRRAHVNTTEKRAEGKVTRSRETNEREQRRNKPAHKQQQQHREGGVKRRERSETKGSTVAHDQLEKVKRDGKVVDEIKMRRMEDNSVVVEKEENDKKKKKDEKNEEKENDDFGGTGSDILIEKEDENNQTMIDLGEAKEVEEAEGSEAVILTATTEGSVSGADAENEEDAVNERDRNEKKKKKKKKKKHKKHEEGEEAERKKHHKQGTGNNEELVTTSEEHESPHKKSKKHKRSREEKEKHKEEKERRREERKRKKEERNHEESLKEEDVVNDTEMILKMVKKDTPLQQQLREIEENEISERVEMSKDDGSLLAAIVSSDSVMEKPSQQTPQRSFIEMTKCDKEKEEKGVDSSRREQKKGGSEVVSVESDKKVTSRGDDRMKTIKRTREDRSEEGTNEKRCRVSGATEKRTTERKTAEEGSDRRKDTVKREYHGASDHSRRRDEKHHSRVNVTLDRTSSWTERNSHRTDSTGTHHQSNKRRSEVKDGKELKFYKHVDEVGKSKETRNQVKPKIEHDTKSEPSIEEQRPEKRKSELESKRSQESTLTNSKRNDEKATVHRTNIRSNEDERIEKEKEKSKRSEERSEKRTESSTRKKGSAKDTDSRKSSTHRRDREDVKVKEKKLDDIKVSIENELAEERKLDTSSSGGDLHRDKPNITVELKYGGEKKVTRENVFENLVPQFNARQKIKMILLSESERFAADKAKKKNVK